MQPGDHGQLAMMTSIATNKEGTLRPPLIYMYVNISVMLLLYSLYVVLDLCLELEVEVGVFVSSITARLTVKK